MAVTFNSLPHAEVDASLSFFWFFRNHFNSPPHAEVDSMYGLLNSVYISFQLTTSRRGRQETIGYQRHIKYFNSLPHAEVDENDHGADYKLCISTHYLTQR